MSIELTITSITEENKREKLHKTSRVLASLLAIPLEVNGECIGAFDKAYKYIRRWKKGEKYQYAYPRNQSRKNSRTKSKEQSANTVPLITGIAPFFNPSEIKIKKKLLKQ